MMLNIKENTIIYIIDYCIETSKKMSNPTLTSVTISSDSGTNNSTIGNEITISIVASENIQQPTIVFKPNNTVSKNSTEYYGSDTNWFGTFIVDLDDELGNVDFTIDFQNISGTSGTQVTSTTDSSSMEIYAGIYTPISRTLLDNNVFGGVIDPESSNDFFGSGLACNKTGTNLL